MDLCHSTDAYGVSMLNPSVEALREILDSIEDEETTSSEHPDVSLTNDSKAWSISVYPSGIVTLEDLNRPDSLPRFMRGVSKNEALKLWIDLQTGRIPALLAREWQS